MDDFRLDREALHHANFSQPIYLEQDIQEFIRLLKEEFSKGALFMDKSYREIIDKLSGDTLI